MQFFVNNLCKALNIYRSDYKFENNNKLLELEYDKNLYQKAQKLYSELLIK